MNRAFTILAVLTELCFLFSTLHVDAASPMVFEIPKTEKDLQSVLTGISQGNILLTDVRGKYALPKLITAGDINIAHFEVENGVVTLVDSGSNAREFTLVKPIVSIDKLLAASRLGDLLAAISTITGQDPRSLFLKDSLLANDTSFSGAMNLPLRFCYIKDHTIIFFSAEYPLKMTKPFVRGIDKPIGDGGPLTFSIIGVDMFLPSGW